MSKVPAWKRLGLKVKEDVTEDPFATTTHFDGSTITNKVAKKLNKKRQLEEGKSDKTKKPPKRVKKPKSDRGPPPERDQLAYLRQFAQDKENWKFSKQKQNWLLKNIDSIPDSYENELIAYFEDIQGGARTRVEEDLRAVINKWNEYSKKLEEKINAELYGEKTEEDESKEEETEESAKETEEKKAEETGPSREYAVRCKKLLTAMLDEPIHLEGETEDAEVEETPKEAETGLETIQTEEKESTPEAEDTPKSEKEDNLIIDEIEVEEYDQKHPGPEEGETLEKTEITSSDKPVETQNKDSEVTEEPKKASKKAKKAKKSKKAKKDEN